MTDYQIITGNSLAVLQTIASSSVDMIATDCPYSSGGQYRSDRTGRTTEKYVQSETRAIRPEFTGDNRDQRSFAYWCALWYSECLRIAKPGALLCSFSDWRQLPTTTDAVQAGGWVWRGIAPWDKTEGARPRRGAFRAQCEYIVWGSNGPMDVADDAPCLPGYFCYPPKVHERLHIAEKPLELMQEIVRLCPEGGLVCDPFTGSGTTGLAAILAGRRFIGIELDEEIAETARQRLAGARRPSHASAGQELLFASEGA